MAPVVVFGVVAVVVPLLCLVLSIVSCAQREKVNSRFEFPRHLNLEPFTREGILRQEKKERIEQELSELEAEEGGDADERERRAQDLNKQLQALEEPYTEKPREYYEYELVGVIVHVGSADSGHYYSFIQTERSSDGQPTGKWLEFNDSSVTPWDYSQAEEAWYGGVSGGNDAAAGGLSWLLRRNEVSGGCAPVAFGSAAVC